MDRATIKSKDLKVKTFKEKALEQIRKALSDKNAFLF